MKIKRFPELIAIALSAIISTSALSGGSVQAVVACKTVDKLTVAAWRFSSAEDTGVHYAQAKGFFERECLKITVVNQGSRNQLLMLHKGELDISNAPQILFACNRIATREDDKCVLVSTDTLDDYGFVASKDSGIDPEKPSLVGKTVSVQRCGAQGASATLSLITEYVHSTTFKGSLVPSIVCGTQVCPSGTSCGSRTSATSLLLGSLRPQYLPPGQHPLH